MKKQILLFCLSALSLAFILGSCKKEDVTLNNGSPIFTMKSLFETLRSEPQLFTVTAGKAQSIVGAEGSKITFHPGSFTSDLGKVITSGTIIIELTEIYRPSQMMANRVFTTTSNNTLLTSGGAVRIKATLEGKEVFAGGNYKLEFKHPVRSSNPMALFNGYPTTDSLGTSIFWNAEDTSNTVPGTVADTLSSGIFYYAFDSVKNFNWINCDYFYTAPAPKSDVSVVFPDSTFNNFNTQVFVIFRNINSVTGMWSYDAKTNTFSLGYAGYHLPVGTTIDIVAISAKKNVYYMDSKRNVQVTNNVSVTLSPVVKSAAAIKSELSGF